MAELAKEWETVRLAERVAQNSELEILLKIRRHARISIANTQPLVQLRPSASQADALQLVGQNSVRVPFQPMDAKDSLLALRELQDAIQDIAPAVGRASGWKEGLSTLRAVLQDARDRPLTVSQQETARLLGLSMATFRRLLKRGDFDHLRAPINFKFSRKKIEEFVNGKTTPWRA